MHQQNYPLNYKIILMGDGGVGKTTFIKRHLDNVFTNQYAPTHGCDVFILIFNTNYGSIKFSIYDLAGQEKYGHLCETYLTNTDGFIGMCSINSKLSANSLLCWYDKMNTSNLPSICCINKIDCDDKKLTHSIITNLNNKYSKYCNVSCRSNHNLKEPFLYLARLLSGHHDLVFLN